MAPYSRVGKFSRIKKIKLVFCTNIIIIKSSLLSNRCTHTREKVIKLKEESSGLLEEAAKQPDFIFSVKIYPLKRII